MSNGISTAVVKLAALLAAAAAQCQPRDYGRGSIVCVCNATYCDFIGDIGSPPNGTAVAFESSKAGQRFTKTTLLFSEETGSTDNHVVLLVVDPSRKYQKVFGFGGAFTDAAGINIKSLPANMQDDIIKSYYAKQGLAYTIGRIPLASCDFSTRKYTYDDSPGDLELKNFTLAPEDFNLKIPYIKAAMSVSSEPIWFFGSAWSSPSWMKTSNTLEGRGTLKGKPGGPYYKAWAKYYVRFVQEYERHGIPIWGLTTQNEPTAGFVPGYRWQALGFTPKTQRDFVKLDLGPALAEAGYGAEKLQVMILDDNRIGLPLWADVDLNHWASGWTDWNLALDTGGGPNWANNFVDSPLIVNVTANEFYKQPTYYALAHFSKFLPRGSVRIECHPEQSLLRNRAHLEYAAFTTPDSAVVVVVLNKHNKKHALKIKDRSGSHTVEKIIDERSITTLIWR
ncbi:lysosomal acid glucosylceramidase isoform X2 [Rhipicephalus microplus]|uniref:lysosomal acid glucosylceramidase isoform X2 n=1 Tax=Rhipicephalus microplus TaxID=6941 RepID=UPI003F6C0CC7